MLEAVKEALKITVNIYNGEITEMITAAEYDLKIAGITNWSDETDPLIRRYIMTFCRAHFGTPPDYDQLKASLTEQMARLKMATGYTDWGDADD